MIDLFGPEFLFRNAVVGGLLVALVCMAIGGIGAVFLMQFLGK